MTEAEFIPTPKAGRARDEFGRPLPHGEPPRLELENFDVLTIEQNHRLGRDYFNASVYFGAHEAWETAWRMSRGLEDEEFYQGLSQLGAGYTHYQRGNPKGARTLMARGAGRARKYGPDHLGIDVEALGSAVDADIARLEGLERGDALPPLDPPRV